MLLKLTQFALRWLTVRHQLVDNLIGNSILTNWNPRKNKRLSQKPKSLSDYGFKKEVKKKGEILTVCLYVMMYIKCRRIT